MHSSSDKTRKMVRHTDNRKGRGKERSKREDVEDEKKEEKKQEKEKKEGTLKNKIK